MEKTYHKKGLVELAQEVRGPAEEEFKIHIYISSSKGKCRITSNPTPPRFMFKGIERKDLSRC
jgi:hypothetical protein